MIRVEQDGAGALAYQPIKVCNMGYHGVLLEQGERTERRCVWVNPASVAALRDALVAVRGMPDRDEHRAFVRGVEAMRRLVLGELREVVGPRELVMFLDETAAAIAEMAGPEDDA